MKRSTSVLCFLALVRVMLPWKTSGYDCLGKLNAEIAENTSLPNVLYLHCWVRCTVLLSPALGKTDPGAGLTSPGRLGTLPLDYLQEV